MAQVPYPLAGDDPGETKRQIWELIRNLFEDRIGGLNLGDVFIDEGDVLTLNLTASGGLEKSSNVLTVKVSSTGGLELSSGGISVKLKSGGGITSSANGLEVTSGAFIASTLLDADTIIKADANDTPVALTIAEQTIVGRITGGVIAALTIAEVKTLLGLPTPLAGTKTYYVADSSGGAVTRKLTFTDGILTSET